LTSASTGYSRGEMKRSLLVVAGALAALALAAPSAKAATCPEQPLAKTFLPWLDPAWYEPAPDAGFESGGSWSLTGGAAIVDGNQPFLAGARSLDLPAGATATTAPVCVTVAHPTLRFFARNAGSASAPLNVSVVFRTPLGQQLELPVGVVLAGAQWAPSPVLPVLANLLSNEVRFRFRPAGGEWQLDDLYIDPYSKG
jgi:hypothetical protein